YSSLNAPVVAVNDGVVQKIGENAKLGRYLVLQDAYGNRYTYAELGQVAKTHPVPHTQALSAKDFRLQGPGGKDSAPAAPATAGPRRRQPLDPPRDPGREGELPSPRATEHRGAPEPPLRQPRPQRAREPEPAERPRRARQPPRQERPRL